MNVNGLSKNTYYLVNTSDSTNNVSLGSTRPAPLQFEVIPATDRCPIASGGTKQTRPMRRS